MQAKKIKINKHLDLARLPQHIAIIMDGNGRWATRRGLPRNFGHKAGCENLKKIVEHIYDLGIKCATFFVFSTENWSRPKEEIDGIFDVVRDYIQQDGEEFVRRGAKIVISGDYKKLPSDIVEAFDDLIEKTKDGTEFTLNLAVNYGARDELLRAFNLAKNAGVELNDPADLEQFLYTAGLPELDFVIRTSGELRLSNFMLWQLSYSELYFTKTFWPSFTPKELQKALINFQNRKRRFGAV